MNIGVRISDTVTNAAYLFAGFVAWGAGAHMVAGALIVLAIASAAYHWTRSDADRRADHIGIYAALIALIGWLAGLPYAATFAAFALVAAFHGRLSLFVTVGILAALACFLLLTFNIVAAIVAAGLFAFALYVRNRFVIGHSMWHLFSSGAFLAAFLA